MSDKFSLRAIMKTDVKDFTKKFNEMSEQEISTIMSEHRQFVLNKAYKFTGKIIKGEGDAFWITFENVTNAVSCGQEIQLELYEKYVGKQDNEVINLRIVITAGEITYKEGDIFGDAVNLAARIETITPSGEIYLSDSANILLNKTQYSTDSVGKYNFKGKDHEIEVYKVNFRYSTKKIDGFIMFVDMNNFEMLIGENKDIDDDRIRSIEYFLDKWDEIFTQTANQNNGKILTIIADAYLIIFDNTINLNNFLIQVDSLWAEFLDKNNNNTNYFGIGLNWGSIHKYKKMAFGKHVNVTARIESSSKRIKKNLNLTGNTIICTNIVADYFKKENLFNESNFVEVTDLSTLKSTHDKVIESYQDMIKNEFIEDINHFLPFYAFVPNPKTDSN